MFGAIPINLATDSKEDRVEQSARDCSLVWPQPRGHSGAATTGEEGKGIDPASEETIQRVDQWMWEAPLEPKKMPGALLGHLGNLVWYGARFDERPANSTKRSRR